MAYYTVAHLLHGEENLDGAKGSPEKIQVSLGCVVKGVWQAEDLTDEVWDFVFLNGRGRRVPPDRIRFFRTLCGRPAPKKSKISKGLLEKMRKEFRRL